MYKHHVHGIYWHRHNLLDAFPLSFHIILRTNLWKYLVWKYIFQWLRKQYRKLNLPKLFSCNWWSQDLRASLSDFFYFSNHSFSVWPNNSSSYTCPPSTLNYFRISHMPSSFLNLHILLKEILSLPWLQLPSTYRWCQVYIEMRTLFLYVCT